MNQFSLPDLKNKKIVFSTYFFNQKNYNFRFEWCETFFIVDIYFTKNGETKYLLKGFPLVANYNLIERIKSPDLISGSLAVKNKYGNDVVIDRENFSTDFVLVYEEE
jgi:hypothetical protein